MQFRTLGRTGWKISTIGFGAWAIGGSWGDVRDEESMAALHRAVDRGVNFFDTADVYGDGRSERLLGRLRRERREVLYIATKAGRRFDPHTAKSYTQANVAAAVERSLRNLGVEALDLLQLHCPPTEVYGLPEVFSSLDDLAREGKIRHYGVSVERVGEALKAVEYPGVQSVQIIFNIFRQKPAEAFFPEAQRRGVGVLARVPLASGLLTGKFDRRSRFAPDDHRAFNREGEAFDRGETFSGVPFGAGLEAVESLRRLVPPSGTLAQMALRWVLMFPAVTSAIPGAKHPAQVDENAATADMPPLPPGLLRAISAIYEKEIRTHVHHLW